MIIILNNENKNENVQLIIQEYLSKRKIFYNIYLYIFRVLFVHCICYNNLNSYDNEQRVYNFQKSLINFEIFKDLNGKKKIQFSKGFSFF